MKSIDIDKDERNSFENIAKDLECDESEDALDKAMENLNLETEKEKDDSEE